MTILLGALVALAVLALLARVAQLAALPPASRPRPVAKVEVRAAPPLRPRSDDATPPAGTPRPRGAA